MYVRMCVLCMYIRMNERMYIRKLCMYEDICVCVCVCMYYVCIYVCMLCMYVFMYVYKYVCTFMSSLIYSFFLPHFPTIDSFFCLKILI